MHEPNLLIPQGNESIKTLADVEKAAQTLLKIGEKSIDDSFKFTGVEYPELPTNFEQQDSPDLRENAAKRSYMLMMTAPEMAEMINRMTLSENSNKLNPDKTASLAAVHGLAPFSEDDKQTLPYLFKLQQELTEASSKEAQLVQLLNAEIPDIVKTLEVESNNNEVTNELRFPVKQMAKHAIKMAGILRMPRYAALENEEVGKKESNAEHSRMVALATIELNHQLGLGLDPGLAARYASVHDLPETIVGDTPTFKISPDQTAEKAKREQLTVAQLLEELPKSTGKLLETYEKQDLLITRTVRAIDKLMPVSINIKGSGMWVMRNEYGVESPEQLHNSHLSGEAKFAQMFATEDPKISGILKSLHRKYEQQFRDEMTAQN